MLSRRQIVVVVAVLLFAALVGAFSLDGASLGDAVSQALQLFTLVSFGNYASVSLMYTAALACAVLIFLYVSSEMNTAVLKWVARDTDGSGDYRRWGAEYLIVAPVDWEKVESVVRQLREELGRFSKLVVVSDHGAALGELPQSLFKRNVRFCVGNIREFGTFVRAGCDKAKGVFVCAPGYHNPVEAAADEATAFTVELLELHRPSLKTVAEVVLPKNEALFRGADFGVDAVVCFDSSTLAAVAMEVARILGGKHGNICAVNLADSEQEAELNRQLDAAGVQQAEDGVVVQIILPTDLDHPAKSDVRSRAQAHLAQQKGMKAVTLFLSVLSEDGFAHRPHSLCADRLMATALVKAML